MEIMQVKSLNQTVRKRRTSPLKFLKRYRARCFLSLPVVMVLVWFCIVIATSGLFMDEEHRMDLMSTVTYVRMSSDQAYMYVFAIVVLLLWAGAGFTSAWLVGWKYRLPSMICAGIVIQSFGILMDNIISVVTFVTGSVDSSPWVVSLGCVSLALIAVGTGLVVTNVLQLAIEQIPEASAAQLSSLISWFVFSAALGLWLNSTIVGIYKHCVTLSDSQYLSNTIDSSYLLYQKYLPVVKLFLSTLMAIVLSCSFLFKHKLLDNSPVSSTTRKIYEVLKYAYKHKYPVQRSALTYWEDTPVSRICVGKRKYGGPFTNEEVEDVRTFLRISVLFVTGAFYIGCLYIHSYSLHYVDVLSAGNHSLHLVEYSPYNNCTKFLIYSFTGSYAWWMAIFTFLYEMLLVPLLSYRMLSILQRLQFTSSVVMLLVIFIFVLVLVNWLPSVTGSLYEVGLHIFLSVTIGVVKSLFYISGLELICAQSPYTMRSFFISSALWLAWSCQLFSGMVFSIWNHFCTWWSCSLIYASITFSLCVVGVILVSIANKCYRKRSRGEEDEHQQRWVEEVYGKYVVEESSKTYGFI